jgi:hypothetical protein
MRGGNFNNGIFVCKDSLQRSSDKIVYVKKYWAQTRFVV